MPSAAVAVHRRDVAVEALGDLGRAACRHVARADADTRAAERAAGSHQVTQLGEPDAVEPLRGSLRARRGDR